MKFGIVGCGAIARRGHLPALRRLGHEVVGVADVNEGTARKAAARFGVNHYFGDYHELLAMGEIETVVITTPTQLHSKIAVDCATVGKNIVVEKPLAMTLRECLEVREAVRSSGVQLSVMQNWRYSPSLGLLKRKLASGEVGRLLSFFGVADGRYPLSWSRSTWRYDAEGVLFDFFPHLADALLWVTNSQAKTVYARGGDVTGSSGFVNLCNMLVVLENDVCGMLATSWLAGVPDFSLELRGTGGLVTANALTGALSQKVGDQTPLDDALDFTRRTVSTAVDYFRGQLFSALKAYESAYLDIIRGFAKGIPPVPVEDGIRTIALLEGAFRSIQQKAPVGISSTTEG
jgi:predicted dehydrogenase